MSDYRVKGGSGGLTVEYEELSASSHRLREAAEQLDEQARQLRRAAVVLTGPAPVDAGGARLNASSVVGMALEDMRLASEHLERTSAGVTESVSNYLETEGVVGRAWFGTGGAGFDSPRYFPQLQPETQTVEVEASLSGLVDRLRKLQESGTRDEFEVLRVERPDGTGVYLVSLPGTQMGSEVFGVDGLREAALRDSEGVSAAVAEALRQAGAAAGDAVILSGYSQGGIHAAAAAGVLDGQGFNVEQVVTIGSPISGIDLPEYTQAIHLENADDWVPGLDMATNRDDGNTVTVWRGGPMLPAPEGQGALGDSHWFANYEQTARIVDAAPEQSVKDSLDHLESVMAGSAVIAGAAGRTAGREDGRAALPGRSTQVKLVPMRPGNEVGRAKDPLVPLSRSGAGATDRPASGSDPARKAARQPDSEAGRVSGARRSPH